MDMDDLLRKTLEKQALRGSASGRGRGRGRGGNSNKGDKKLGGRSLHLSFLINDGLLKPGILAQTKVVIRRVLNFSSNVDHFKSPATPKIR